MSQSYCVSLFVSCVGTGCRRASLLDDGIGKLKMVLAVDEFNNFFKPCAASITKFEQVL